MMKLKLQNDTDNRLLLLRICVECLRLFQPLLLLQQHSFLCMMHVFKFLFELGLNRIVKVLVCSHPMYMAKTLIYIGSLASKNYTLFSQRKKVDVFWGSVCSFLTWLISCHIVVLVSLQFVELLQCDFNFTLPKFHVIY
jgi:hypothetical protein